MNTSVKTCCFCMDLKKGAIIIGSLQLIATVIVYSLYLLDTPRTYFVSDYPDVPVKCERSIIDIPFCFFVAIATINTLLIIGALRDMSKYIKPWIILSLIEIILLGIAIVIGFIIMLFSGGPCFSDVLCWIAYICSIFILFLKVHFWLVVRSLKDEVTNRENA